MIGKAKLITASGEESKSIDGNPHLQNIRKYYLRFKDDNFQAKFE